MIKKKTFMNLNNDRSVTSRSVGGVKEHHKKKECINRLKDSQEMIEGHTNASLCNILHLYPFLVPYLLHLSELLKMAFNWASSPTLGVSVSHIPSAVPPAAQCTAGWAPGCHKWCCDLQLLLPHSAR